MSASSSQSIGLRLVLPLAILTALLAGGLLALQLRASNRLAAESLDGYAHLPVDGQAAPAVIGPEIRS